MDMGVGISTNTRQSIVTSINSTVLITMLMPYIPMSIVVELLLVEWHGKRALCTPNKSGGDVDNQDMPKKEKEFKTKRLNEELETRNRNTQLTKKGNPNDQ
jgi:hypothetical protein